MLWGGIPNLFREDIRNFLYTVQLTSEFVQPMLLLNCLQP